MFKSLFNFFFNDKKEYIGLSELKEEPKNRQPKRSKKVNVQKTALTGMIRRAN